MIGLSLSSRADLTSSDFVAHAVAAEAAGADAVFATENASDAMAIATAMATATSRVQVGTAITTIGWRHPALAAVGAGAAAQLSDGRFVLGLGVGNPGVNQDQLGLPSVSSLTAMREYVRVVRATLSGQPVHFDGEVQQISSFTSSTSGIGSVPVWVAALQPGMLGLAGQIGDGVLLTLSTPEMVADAIVHVRAGADAADRDPAAVQISCVVPFVHTADPEAADIAARRMVAGYATHPAAGSLFAAAAAGTDIPAVARAMRDGDLDIAAGLVDPRFAEQLVVTDNDLEKALAPYRSAGVDLPILFPIPVGGSWASPIDAAIEAIRTQVIPASRPLYEGAPS